jgi:hypothetical protein
VIRFAAANNEIQKYKIQNSKFKIQNSKFKIQNQNSKFKIQNPNTTYYQWSGRPAAR